VEPLSHSRGDLWLSARYPRIDPQQAPCMVRSSATRLPYPYPESRSSRNTSNSSSRINSSSSSRSNSKSNSHINSSGSSTPPPPPPRPFLCGLPKRLARKKTASSTKKHSKVVGGCLGFSFWSPLETRGPTGGAGGGGGGPPPPPYPLMLSNLLREAQA
jgi:hypothetical protein